MEAPDIRPLRLLEAAVPPLRIQSSRTVPKASPSEKQASARWKNSLLPRSTGRRALVSRVFWPAAANSQHSGFLVGWNIRNFICCVAALVTDIRLQDLELALLLLANDPDVVDLWAHCSGPPIVLGTWNAPRISDSANGREIFEDCREEIANKKRFANFWISLEAVPTESDPQKWLIPGLKDLFCCGFAYKSSPQIIFYERPEASSFYSSRPLTFEFSLIGHNSQPSHALKKRGKMPNPGLSSHPLPKTDLDFVLQQINSAEKVEQLLFTLIRSSSPLELFGSSSHESVASSEMSASSLKRKESSRKKHLRYRSSSSDVLWSDEYYGSFYGHFDVLKPSKSLFSKSSMSSISILFLSPLLRLIFLALHILLGSVRMVMLLTTYILDLRIPSFLGGGKMKSPSIIGHQLHFRITEICRWPYMWLRTRGKWKNDSFSSASFICFYGSVCQVFGDLLIGLLLGLFFRAYSHQLLYVLHELGQILHVDVLRGQIEWLMGFPAGMKLNQDLDRFLGSVVLYSIDVWNEVTTRLTPLEPLILKFISLFGFFGFSMILALASDLLTLLTIHIRLLHSVFALIYAIEITALSALWKLFTGKKKNVLRNRIDSCSYEMDQLLVGTILFTLTFFLFPTIAVYYVFFSFVRALTNSAQAFLWFLLAFMNYFPFFAVLLYIFRPGRLPGGIWMEIIATWDEAHAQDLRLRATQEGSVNSSVSLSAFFPSLANVIKSTSMARLGHLKTPTQEPTYLILKNRIVPASALFSQYRHVVRRLMQHFSPRKSIRHFIFGTFTRKETGFASEEAEEDNIYTPGLIDFWFFCRVYLNWGP